jgi:serine/threonine protein kinase
VLAEARLASRLNHPHICTIYEVAETEAGAILVLECVEGQPLTALIPKEGLPLELVLRYGSQIADAVAHAHAQGIVHGDLKSANVMVTEDGRAKVLDFGLAQRLSAATLDMMNRSQTALSADEPTVGTLPYMAPEMLRGEASDARSDIWALGVLLYEMAAGELPFQGRTGFELSAAILHDASRALPARVPGGLRAIIRPGEAARAAPPAGRRSARGARGAPGRPAGECHRSDPYAVDEAAVARGRQRPGDRTRGVRRVRVWALA